MPAANPNWDAVSPSCPLHGQRRDAKAGAIQIIEEIGDGEQRHEPQRGLFYRALQHGIRRLRCLEIAGSALL